MNLALLSSPQDMLDVARLDCNNSTFNGRIYLLFVPFTSKFFISITELVFPSSGYSVSEWEFVKRKQFFFTDSLISTLPVSPVVFFMDFVITTKNMLDMFNTSLAQKKNKLGKENLLSRARF